MNWSWPISGNILLLHSLTETEDNGEKSRTGYSVMSITAITAAEFELWDLLPVGNNQWSWFLSTSRLHFGSTLLVRNFLDSEHNFSCTDFNQLLWPLSFVAVWASANGMEFIWTRSPSPNQYFQTLIQFRIAYPKSPVCLGVYRHAVSEFRN